MKLLQASIFPDPDRYTWPGAQSGPRVPGGHPPAPGERSSVDVVSPSSLRRKLGGPLWGPSRFHRPPGTGGGAPGPRTRHPDCAPGHDYRSGSGQIEAC